MSKIQTKKDFLDVFKQYCLENGFQYTGENPFEHLHKTKYNYRIFTPLIRIANEVFADEDLNELEDFFNELPS